MCYMQNQETVIRRVDDSVFLVNPATDAMFLLDGAGSVLWLALAEPLAAEDAVRLLLIAFPEADSGTVSHDVDALIRELLDHQLIVEVQ